VAYHLAMTKPKIIQHGALHALLAAVYVGLIATLLHMGQVWFGGDNRFLVPMGMLLLLCLSAAIMGVLIFGRPVMLYIDGAKKEAVQMLGYTLASLAIITVLVFVAMAASRPHLMQPT